MSAEPCPYRGCWHCGLYFGEMTERTEDDLRARGYAKFDVKRPPEGAVQYVPHASPPGGSRGHWETVERDGGL